jgi:energy-coupling factor transporter ATP-binding protein EcfA2
VLALIVWQRPNLLLLDEPTNHLDLDMRQALTEALIEFEGALVVVSHDRHLLRSTTDDLYLVHDRKVEPFDGDLEDYQQWLSDVQKQENQMKHLHITRAALSQKTHCTISLPTPRWKKFFHSTTWISSYCKENKGAVCFIKPAYTSQSSLS